MCVDADILYVSVWRCVDIGTVCVCLGVCSVLACVCVLVYHVHAMECERVLGVFARPSHVGAEVCGDDTSTHTGVVVGVLRIAST